MALCLSCRIDFVVSNEDREFYKKMSPIISGQIFELPDSKLCPSCRERRRLSFRNERHLYNRNSSLSGKPMVSTYSPEKPYTVYTPKEWWGDSWDALNYGRDFDFNRPFFEQFDELWKAVPQMGLLNSNNENAEYATFSEQDKNCYLVFASNRNQDCYYSSYIWDSKDCMDCLNVERSQSSYMCTDAINAYQCCFSQNVHDSQNLAYCFNCRACRDCFACCGLRKKSFHILNEPHSEKEYREILSSPERVKEILNKYRAQKLNTPRLFADLIQCEDSSGSHLRNCRRAKNSFDCFDCEDVRWAENCPGKVKDSYDISGATHTELGMELVSVAFGYRVFACLYAHNSTSDAYYSVACPGSKNIFGCNGVRKGEYCILNKRYEKSEYQKMLARVIAHMQKTGEWGEFFPMSISPYDYVDTCAEEKYPMSQKDIRPVNFAHSPDLIECKNCLKGFKLITQELEFYKKMGLFRPTLCPDCRHRVRFQERTPKKLWTRSCTKCGIDLQSPYAPGRQETVYCEKCYLATVY